MHPEYVGVGDAGIGGVGVSPDRQKGQPEKHVNCCVSYTMQLS